MNETQLGYVLEEIGLAFENKIRKDSEIYRLVDIGGVFPMLKDEITERFGAYDARLEERFNNVNVVVPVTSSEGLLVQVNGRELADYVQLSSGIAVQKWVAEEAQITGTQYQPKNNMYIDFA